MEYKTLPHYTKAINGRTVTGVMAVHGNIDDGDDVSWPGSFAKTILENRQRMQFLWQHRSYDPPIAVIEDVRELARDQLPAAVLLKAPDATGGVEMTRRYLKNARAEEVFEGIVEGAIKEMSYAYDAVKFDFSEALSGRRVRNLREIRLHEGSDVNWGMNPATVGSKGEVRPDPVLQHLLRHMAEMQAGMKAGARHSAADMAMLNQIAMNAILLGADNAKLLEELVEEDAAGKGAVTTTLQDITALKRRLMKVSIDIA